MVSVDIQNQTPKITQIIIELIISQEFGRKTMKCTFQILTPISNFLIIQINDSFSQKNKRIRLLFLLKCFLKKIDDYAEDGGPGEV